MTFWNKVSNQNKIDSSLISELNDISYRSIGGKRQQPRGSKEGITNSQFRKYTIRSKSTSNGNNKRDDTRISKISTRPIYRPFNWP